MGICLSKWFTEAHHRYRKECPTLDHHIQVPDAEMEKDPFYLVEIWPIPITWTRMMFQPNTWDSRVRQFGTAATKMGPISFGTERYTWDKESYHNVLETVASNTANRPIFPSMAANQVALWTEENKRRAQARSIIMRVTTIRNAISNSHPENHRSGNLDAWDSAPDTEDEEDEKSPICPRWDEIRQYLFNTRGPSNLAWNSMTFEIPEWTLYQYIQFHGGLVITPGEWHCFLVFANYREQLFQ